MERLHPSDLGPPMSAIAALTSANFLTAESIAVSIILEATIVVSTRSALMDRATAPAGVDEHPLATRDRWADATARLPTLDSPGLGPRTRLL